MNLFATALHQCLRRFATALPACDRYSHGGTDHDGGEVDSGALRASIGSGISWISPFGAIGIDVGFPVLKESFDEVENIRFNFGTKF